MLIELSLFDMNGKDGGVAVKLQRVNINKRQVLGRGFLKMFSLELIFITTLYLSLYWLVFFKALS